MVNKKKPPKWTNVYPVGTKEGDEECRFFKVLDRHPVYTWRSTAAIVRESGLPRKRVEEIIAKYHRKGMVFQNPKNEDSWGYWELHPGMVPEESEPIVKIDQANRIKKSLNK